MGLLQSQEAIDFEQDYKIKLNQPYPLCCGFCCKSRADTTKRGEKWIPCGCCAQLWYCSNRCRLEDAETHRDPHREKGEAVLLTFEPRPDARNQWYHAPVNSTGLRGHNPRKGAVRIALENSCIRVAQERDGYARLVAA